MNNLYDGLGELFDELRVEVNAGGAVITGPSNEASMAAAGIRQPVSFSVDRPGGAVHFSGVASADEALAYLRSASGGSGGAETAVVYCFAAALVLMLLLVMANILNGSPTTVAEVPEREQQHVPEGARWEGRLVCP